MAAVNPLIFWLLAVVAVVSASRHRQAQSSGSALAWPSICGAGRALRHPSATFLFVIQILVYAGAVVVLIIFVICSQLRQENLKEAAIQRESPASLGCLMAAALPPAVVGRSRSGAGPLPPPSARWRDGRPAFHPAISSFEVVSLLCCGIVAVVIAQEEE